MTLESAIQWAFGAPGRIQQNEWELRTFLCKVISELNPRGTIELGSWRGTTAALLAFVTKGKTVSLDIQDYGGKDEALKLCEGHDLTFLNLSARRPEIVADVWMAVGGPPDLLFIDDGHRIEEVTEEFDIWSGIMPKGSWIAFHDINPDANKLADGTHPDICMAHEFWAKLEGNKEEIIFRGTPPGPGIGILRV